MRRRLRGRSGMGIEGLRRGTSNTYESRNDSRVNRQQREQARPRKSVEQLGRRELGESVGADHVRRPGSHSRLAQAPPTSAIRQSSASHQLRYLQQRMAAAEDARRAGIGGYLWSQGRGRFTPLRSADNATVADGRTSARKAATRSAGCSNMARSRFASVPQDVALRRARRRSNSLPERGILFGTLIAESLRRALVCKHFVRTRYEHFVAHTSCHRTLHSIFRSIARSRHQQRRRRLDIRQ